MTRRTLAALALVGILAPRVNAQQVGLFKEDTAHVSGQYGFFGLAVRKDAAGTLCDADGDFCPFQVDATGQVRVVAAQGGAPWSVTGSGTFTVAGTIAQGNGGSHAQRWMVGLSDGAGFISPATDRTTAAGPFSLRLSDGSAFYDSAKTGQLPAALDGSGFFKVHEQGTATVSGTVTANAGSNLNTSALALDATITGRLPAGSTPANGESNAITTSRLGSLNFVYNGVTWDRWTGAVTGTVAATQSGTWTVQPGNTANTTPWLVELSQTGSKNDVDVLTLPANASVNLAQVGGTNVSTGTGAGGAGIPRVTVSNDSTVGLVAGTARIGSVRPVDSADADLTAAKGTQTARAIGTQDLKDAGRTAISFYANAVASGTTGTETLITLNQSKGTGATSSASTYTITNGKTLRITGIQVASRGNATATAQTTTFNLRLNTAGACVVTSTPILMGIGTATPATASTWDRAPNPFSSDGYEIAGNGTIALCISAAAVFVTNAPTWYVNIIGYEY